MKRNFLLLACAFLLQAVQVIAQQSNFKEKTVFKNDDVEIRQLDANTLSTYNSSYVRLAIVFYVRLAIVRPYDYFE